MSMHLSPDATTRTVEESTVTETETAGAEYFAFEHPRYFDIEPISHGTFGDVRRVYDLRSTMVLAMKIMRSHSAADTRQVSHFATEIDIMTELRHPGILPLYDWGEFDDGRIWLTMPEVPGCTFSSMLDELHDVRGSQGFQWPLSGGTFRRALEALAQLCATVAYAHEQDIIHRDLKPQNVLVGTSGKTFVIDWGMARRQTLTESRVETSFRISARPLMAIEYGTVVGTPAYMPPEQASGDLSLQSPASDVYSLGAILYHLLVGRPPYVGSRTAAMARINRGTPRPIAAMTGAHHVLPRELVALCETTMQRDPAARRVGAGAMGQTILDWLDKTDDRV